MNHPSSHTPLTVGILTRRSSDDPAQPFGRPTTFFAECCTEAERLGIQVVVFDVEDLDRSGAPFSAATFTNGGWEHLAVGFPDVVYDRAPLFDPVSAPIANRARRRLIDAGVPFINPLVLLHVVADKLATHRLLSRHGIRMPETTLVDDGGLDAYLERFDHLFLKPVRGSNGMGIIEVRRSEHGAAVVRYGCERMDIQSAPQLHQVIGSLIGNSESQGGVYLIQQGIAMDRAGAGRFPRFDLRVLMQKDERKTWGMTGLVARVSQSDVPTTNLSTGGRAEVAEHVLDQVYGPALRRSIIASMARTCLTICQLLDGEVCVCGELGIDIVTDAEGQAWVIEINAKPGRSVFKRIAQSAEVSEEDRQRFARIRQRAVAMPFRYAKALVT